MRQGLGRFRSYLGLVALLSLILGGIGVAQIVRTWLASRLLSVAVWNGAAHERGSQKSLSIWQELQLER